MCKPTVHYLTSTKLQTDKVRNSLVNFKRAEKHLQIHAEVLLVLLDV